MNDKLTAAFIAQIEALPPPLREKMRLARLFPHHYTGMAAALLQRGDPNVMQTLVELATEYHNSYVALLWLIRFPDRHGLSLPEVIRAAEEKNGGRGTSFSDGVAGLLPADVEKILQISLFPPAPPASQEPSQ